MGYSEPWLYESDEDMVKGLLDSRHPYLRGVTYAQLRERGFVRLALPEPWLPFAAGNFKTPSGKREFYSETLAAQGLDPLPAYVAVAQDGPAPAGRPFPLALITSKSTRHFNNSSHAGEARQRKAEGEPRLQMHAEDAAPRHIRDGDIVRVFNHRGAMTLRAHPDGLSDQGGGGDFHDARVEVERTSV